MHNDKTEKHYPKDMHLRQIRLGEEDGQSKKGKQENQVLFRNPNARREEGKHQQKRPLDREREARVSLLGHVVSPE